MIKFVTGHAIAHGDRAVLEDEGTAFVGVAVEAGELARGGCPQTSRAGPAVWLVARRAFHSAAAQLVRVWLITKR